jgi:hypothetical protein
VNFSGSIPAGQIIDYDSQFPIKEKPHRSSLSNTGEIHPTILFENN